MDVDLSAARPLRIALAQMNPVVGDLDGNTGRVIEWIDRAREAGADLVAFPELAITGYPPEDLLLKPSFVRDNLACRDRVVAASDGIAVVCGYVDVEVDIYNAALVARDGRLAGVYHKVYLPNYGVFDEERYFQRGRRCPIFELNGVRFGVSICEDAWYPAGPVSLQAQLGAELLVNINGSPYHRGKRVQRETMIATRAMDGRAFLAWVNMTGGQDELVFDGNSAVFNPDGEVVARAAGFEEELLVADVDLGSVFGDRLHDTRLRREAQGPPHLELVPSAVRIDAAPHDAGTRPIARQRLATPLEGPAEVYRALVTGTHDYLTKASPNRKAVLGLSGGIDSALTAAIAADAIGPENVTGVLMPSRYTSQASLDDAQELARALGITTLVLPISEPHDAFERTLAGAFEGRQPDVTEENIQARVRGVLLMALSNKFGWLVLSTGNKSELATGYCTLYGDMAGGFAVIKDIPKTLVYELCRYRNTISPVIPESVISRAPSAELRPDQKDEDSLPPYALLDPILEAYVEDDRGPEELVAAGHDSEIVSRVIQLVDQSEYKRRQGAPGVKITPRAFGRDRRMPISNRYRPRT